MVSYGLPSPGLGRGGIERVAHDLAHGLAVRGHRVTVWSYDPKPPSAAYEHRLLPGRRFALHPLGRRVTMGYLGNVISLLPRYAGADVIIAHGDSLLLPLLGRPVVRVMHGSALGEAMTATNPFRMVHQFGVYLQELLTALTQRACVAVSHGTRRFNPFVREVIPNGADLRLFTPDPRARSRTPHVLFVGALGGRKRGHLLVEWFTRTVRPRYPDARLTMLSDSGPMLPGVEYRRGVSPGELAALYRSAWVYASPSTYEGFGLPYLEAMASGTPVLATPNDGSRELLGAGDYGILASDTEFASSLADLLGNAPRREALAVRGLRRAEEYGLERTISAYEELLTRVSARGRA
jgi:glycosyltransferase involved in cell wall biosynthesis